MKQELLTHVLSLKYLFLNPSVLRKSVQNNLINFVIFFFQKSIIFRWAVGRILPISFFVLIFAKEFFNILYSYIIMEIKILSKHCFLISSKSFLHFKGLNNKLYKFRSPLETNQLDIVVLTKCLCHCKKILATSFDCWVVCY